MIIDYIEKICPECGEKILCDVHECNCVFGICEACGQDFEFEKNCTNK